MRSWRLARSVHDPGKTVLDLAVTIALGGDCLADAALVRAQSELFGAVASDPTISRLVDALGADPAAAIAAIRRARAAAREVVWQSSSPVAAAGEVVVDLDATLIGAHSDKEGATPNFKRGYGFHPMMAFVDHGTGGTGEPLAAMLRPGRANASDAADQIAVLDAASRFGRTVSALDTETESDHREVVDAVTRPSLVAAGLIGRGGSAYWPTACCQRWR